MDAGTRLEWEGRWDQVKGWARSKWGQLTDDDVDVAEGNWEELVGRIKARTGKAVDDIQDEIDEEFSLT